MVAAMSVLSQQLLKASVHGPTEVILATGCHVRVRRSDDNSVELCGTACTTKDLSEALSEVLTAEQQALLGLGAAVQFTLTTEAIAWELTATTTAEGIVIRACTSNLTTVRAANVGLDLVDADITEVELEAEAKAFAEAVHIDVIYLSEELDIPRLRRATGSGPSDIDIEIYFDDDHRSDDRPPVNLRLASRNCQVTSGQRTRVGSGPRTMRTPLVALPNALATHNAGLDEFRAAWTPGTLAVVFHAVGLVDVLLTTLELPAMVVTERFSVAEANARLATAAADQAIAVCVEDPSVWLGWLLRRVDEGRQVLVYTNAATFAGAQRTVLGLEATPRAEAWLAALPTLHVQWADDRWQTTVVAGKNSVAAPHDE